MCYEKENTRKAYKSRNTNASIDRIVWGSPIAFFQKTSMFIDEYSRKLRLPEALVNEAKLVAERAIRENIALGYKPEEIAAASIYVACRKNKVPFSFREIVNSTRVNRAKLGHLYKRIILYLNIKIPLPDPEDYLTKRLAPLLGVGSEVVSRAKEIIARLKAKGFTCGKNPGAVAAAAVYLASISLRQPVKISRLARASGVTSVTVKNVAKALVHVLGFKP